jgi:hypothetical protein
MYITVRRAGNGGRPFAQQKKGGEGFPFAAALSLGFLLKSASVLLDSKLA